MNDRIRRMRGHVRADVALGFSFLALIGGWAHSLVAGVTARAPGALAALDLLLRIALSIVGIYAAYWSARYYRTNSRRRHGWPPHR